MPDGFSLRTLVDNVASQAFYERREYRWIPSTRPGGRD